MTESNRLPILAAEIGTAHSACQKAGREFVRHAVEAGRRLIEAKALVQHGEWSAWLTKNVPELHPRTARRYMSAAKSVGKLDTVSVFTLRHLIEPRRAASPALRAARALGAEQDALTSELSRLRNRLDYADLDETIAIRDRTDRIYERLVDIRVTAERECRRLAFELGVEAPC